VKTLNVDPLVFISGRDHEINGVTRLILVRGEFGSAGLVDPSLKDDHGATAVSLTRAQATSLAQALLAWTLDPQEEESRAPQVFL